MKLDQTERKVVRVKTLTEFLQTGWVMDSENNLHFPSFDTLTDSGVPSVLSTMHYLFGKTILITKDTDVGDYIYEDKHNNNKFIIDEKMISEELNPEDYPEFFI